MKPMYTTYTTVAGRLIHGASSRGHPNLLARFGTWEWLRSLKRVGKGFPLNQHVDGDANNQHEVAAEVSS